MTKPLQVSNLLRHFFSVSRSAALDGFASKAYPSTGYGIHSCSAGLSKKVNVNEGKLFLTTELCMLTPSRPVLLIECPGNQIFATQVGPPRTRLCCIRENRGKAANRKYRAGSLCSLETCLGWWYTRIICIRVIYRKLWSIYNRRIPGAADSFMFRPGLQT